LVTAAVFVNEGTVNMETAWVCTNDVPPTLGTSSISFQQFAGGGAVTAGTGLTQSGNTLNVGAGTGITVAADAVSLDTTYTDTRYLNATGPDTGTGLYTTGGSGSGWKVNDFADPIDTRQFGSAFSFYSTGDVYRGGMLHDYASNRLSLNYTGGSILLNSPAVTVSSDPDQAMEVATKQYVDNADLTKVPTTRTLTAGNGLTGGGDLSANRQLDVGAGTGITVAADTVALDTTYADARYALAAAGVKRYVTSVGGAVSQVITHNLASRDVFVQVYRVAAPGDTVECDVERTSTNSVTLRFTIAPAASEYNVVVLA
jgi:hypothetical protein